MSNRSTKTATPSPTSAAYTPPAREEVAVRRPLMGLLTCLAAGIWLGLVLPVPPLLPLSLTALLVGGTLSLMGRRYRLPLTWLAVVLLGTTLAALQMRPPANRALHRLMERPREFLTIRGQIIDDPILLEVGERGEHWRFTLRLDEVNRIGEFEPAEGRVDVQLRSGPENRPDPLYGDHWELSGNVQHFAREGQWRWAALPP